MQDCRLWGRIAVFVKSTPLGNELGFEEVEEPCEFLGSEGEVVNHEAHAVGVVFGVQADEEFCPFEGCSVGAFHD